MVEDREETSQKIDDSPVLATCQSGTFMMLFTKVNSPVVHESRLVPFCLFLFCLTQIKLWYFVYSTNFIYLFLLTLIDLSDVLFSFTGI